MPDVTHQQGEIPVTTETTSICESLRSVAEAIEASGFEDRIEWASVSTFGKRVRVRVKSLQDLREMFPGEKATKGPYCQTAFQYTVTVDGVDYWAAHWPEVQKEQEVEQVTL